MAASAYDACMHCRLIFRREKTDGHCDRCRRVLTEAPASLIQSLKQARRAKTGQHRRISSETKRKPRSDVPLPPNNQRHSGPGRTLRVDLPTVTGESLGESSDRRSDMVRRAVDVDLDSVPSTDDLLSALESAPISDESGTSKRRDTSGSVRRSKRLSPKSVFVPLESFSNEQPGARQLGLTPTRSPNQQSEPVKTSPDLESSEPIAAVQFGAAESLMGVAESVTQRNPLNGGAELFAESGKIGDSGISAQKARARKTKSKEQLDEPVPFGDYRLEAILGRGGMGVVYKATQVSLGRSVALKLMTAQTIADEDRIRFQREAKAAARLRHKNIVPIFDVGSHGGHDYFTLELIEGEDLHKIATERRLNLSQALDIVRKIAEGIEYAHEQGVIHRDLKPQNILVDRDMEPHVTDFGLAKDLQDAVNLTTQGVALGSPPYMPPEQAMGKYNLVDKVSDVYGIGAILYECLTGRPPFVGETAYEILARVQADDVLEPRRIDPDLPKDVEIICLTALEKDRSQRYQSARALAADIARYQRGDAILAREPTFSIRIARQLKKYRTLSSSIAVFLGILITLVMFFNATDKFKTFERITGNRQNPFANVEVSQKLSPNDEALKLFAAGQPEQAIRIASRALQSKSVKIRTFTDSKGGDEQNNLFAKLAAFKERQTANGEEFDPNVISPALSFIKRSAHVDKPLLVNVLVESLLANIDTLVSVHNSESSSLKRRLKSASTSSEVAAEKVRELELKFADRIRQFEHAVDILVLHFIGEAYKEETESTTRVGSDGMNARSVIEQERLRLARLVSEVERLPQLQSITPGKPRFGDAQLARQIIAAATRVLLMQKFWSVAALTRTELWTSYFTDLKGRQDKNAYSYYTLVRASGRCAIKLEPSVEKRLELQTQIGRIDSTMRDLFRFADGVMSISEDSHCLRVIPKQTSQPAWQFPVIDLSGDIIGPAWVKELSTEKVLRSGDLSQMFSRGFQSATFIREGQSLSATDLLEYKLRKLQNGYLEKAGKSAYPTAPIVSPRRQAVYIGWLGSLFVLDGITGKITRRIALPGRIYALRSYVGDSLLVTCVKLVKTPDLDPVTNSFREAIQFSEYVVYPNRPGRREQIVFLLDSVNSSKVRPVPPSDWISFDPLVANQLEVEANALTGFKAFEEMRDLYRELLRVNTPGSGRTRTNVLKEMARLRSETGIDFLDRFKKLYVDQSLKSVIECSRIVAGEKLGRIYGGYGYQSAADLKTSRVGQPIIALQFYRARFVSENREAGADVLSNPEKIRLLDVLQNMRGDSLTPYDEIEVALWLNENRAFAAAQELMTPALEGLLERYRYEPTLAGYGETDPSVRLSRKVDDLVRRAQRLNPEIHSAELKAMAEKYALIQGWRDVLAPSLSLGFAGTAKARKAFRREIKRPQFSPAPIRAGSKEQISNEFGGIGLRDLMILDYSNRFLSWVSIGLLGLMTLLIPIMRARRLQVEDLKSQGIQTELGRWSEWYRNPFVRLRYSVVAYLTERDRVGLLVGAGLLCSAIVVHDAIIDTLFRREVAPPAIFSGFPGHSTSLSYLAARARRSVQSGRSVSPELSRLLAFALAQAGESKLAATWYEQAWALGGGDLSDSSPSRFNSKLLEEKLNDYQELTLMSSGEKKAVFKAIRTTLSASKAEVHWLAYVLTGDQAALDQAYTIAPQRFMAFENFSRKKFGLLVPPAVSDRDSVVAGTPHWSFRLGSSFSLLFFNDVSSFQQGAAVKTVLKSAQYRDNVSDYWLSNKAWIWPAAMILFASLMAIPGARRHTNLPPETGQISPIIEIHLPGFFQLRRGYTLSGSILLLSFVLIGKGAVDAFTKGSPFHYQYPKMLELAGRSLTIQKAFNVQMIVLSVLSLIVVYGIHMFIVRRLANAEKARENFLKSTMGTPLDKSANPTDVGYDSDTVPQ